MSFLICPCNDVDEGQVRGAVADGARTLDEVFARLGKPIFCGQCLVDIDRILFAADG